MDKFSLNDRQVSAGERESLNAGIGGGADILFVDRNSDDGPVADVRMEDRKAAIERLT